MRAADNRNSRATAGTSWVILSGIALMQGNSSLLTPLYPFYQERWKFSAAFITVLFTIFVAGVLIALLVIGPSADIWGRRHTLFGSALLSLAACAVYGFAGHLAWIAVGNLLQGMAVGIFMGVGPAVLAGAYGPGQGGRVGRLTTFASAIGLGGGPLWSGLLFQHAPDPGRLVFLIQGVLTAALIISLYRIAPDPPRSRHPAVVFARLGVPPGFRSIFSAAAIAGWCSFAVGALFASIGAVLVRDLMHVRSTSIAGLAVALVFAVSGAIQAALASVVPRTAVRSGLICCAFGLVLLLLAPIVGTMALFFASAVVLGAGQGAILAGSLALVTDISSDNYRAAAMSSFFVACYLGTTLSVLGVGAVIATDGIGFALAVFAVVMALLSSLHGSFGVARLLPQSPAG